MLNKDQYNQEEYNDYYRQETEGAELGPSKNEESGLMGKLIILLIILALAIAGYFGYKAMNTSDLNDIDTSLQVSAESSLPQSVQEESETIQPTQTIESVEKEPNNVAQDEKPKTIETEVNSEVAKAVGTEGKMSPEEIAAVVTAVMKQMSDKETSKEPSSNTVAVKNDAELMNKLSSSEVDTVSTDLINELEDVNINENTQVNDTQKQVDVYNKINVQNVSGTDTLSQLSDEINAVIDEGVAKDKVANYTNSLKSEVDVRKNEMRIIVVAKGDTLGQIAKRAYGNVMDYKKIYQANPELTRPDRIYVGQKLRIPN
ncbi:MAG: Unknown protein [uncultured Sulfurovum sp.]|uniref:LysM domain-containing protein n=1 Tax=uncultured Sulfurovum sp. TaxID=269237 RepID=A0A6S6U0E2_9BACT|nr:MAG: Unknown protein [uncultured Sulfurovum sp.]